jgi:hypothetical protein
MRSSPIKNILSDRSSFLITAVLLIVLSGGARAQTPFEPGQPPRKWISAGAGCARISEFQIHKYNEDFYILRQSGGSHYEKPLLYLELGRAHLLELNETLARMNGNTVPKVLRDFTVSPQF